MTENRFEELHEDNEQILVKLKAETDPERRLFYLREVSRLLTEGDSILQTPKKDTTSQ